MEGHNFSPNPTLVEEDPDVYLSMGLTAENLADQYQVPREKQDEFSFGSHQKALDAQAAGRFEEELIPLQVTLEELKEGHKQSQVVEFKVDEGPRADTSLEALAQLNPVFKVGGTVTAGNSSQRSDGAAGVVVMSLDKAQELALQPLGRLVSYVTVGVAPELMGIGPVQAIPKALRLAELEMKDIGLIELNEAFAVQVLSVIQETGLDPEIVNVNGGAIALGHPLGCTGAKLTTTILFEMKRRAVRYGLVTMCIGGGMGAAGVIECYCA
jgi:acetyl-CoA acyltransferase